jgi:hypothetical protein
VLLPVALRLPSFPPSLLAVRLLFSQLPVTQRRFLRTPLLAHLSLSPRRTMARGCPTVWGGRAVVV